MDEFKGSSGAGFNTQRLPLAQLTFICFLGFRIYKDHPHGTVLGTKTAADTSIRVYADNTLVISLDCLCRTNIQTIGILALIANRWQMIEILPFIFNDQA